MYLFLRKYLLTTKALATRWAGQITVVEYGRILISTPKIGQKLLTKMV